MNIDINRVKIVTAAPLESIERVRNAILEAGAGIIGNYTHCSMSTKCTGTFMPNDKSNPYIGEKNKMELVEEERIEVVCNADKIKDVIVALRKAHPYEEPAIDIIPLIDENYFN